MSGSGWEALPDVRDGRIALPDDRERSRRRPGGPSVVEMPSRMSRSGREAIPDVWEW